jgi:outer membrane receptor protein involved in Fe transport
MEKRDFPSGGIRSFSFCAMAVSAGLAASAGIADGQVVPPAQNPIVVAPAAGAETPPAKAAPSKSPIGIRTIRVNVAPLGGAEINAGKWPAAIQQFGSRQINRNGNPSVVSALDRSASGVNLQNSQANPYQPDIIYHGFTLSPIQGTPEGISVYVNGARFNVPFGDLALWSVLPQVAIRSISVQDANPLFGLNALGGALDVQMKNGFTYHGAEVEASGGSFGTFRGNAQYGVQHGNVAAYAAIQGARSSGWRDAQSSALESFYGDLGWRGPGAELHVNATLGHSFLNGPAATPVQLLAVNPNAEYTGPNSIEDKYAKLSATLTDRINARTSLQAVLYYDNLWEHLINGNGPNDLPCGAGPYGGDMCQGGSNTPATLAGGGYVPYYASPTGRYGSLAVNTTNTNGYGASLQFTRKQRVFGLRNHIVAGVSFDGGFTNYTAASYDGILNAERNYAPPPGIAYPGYKSDEAGAVPVGIVVRNAYYGLYLLDTLDLTRRLTLTLGGRFNIANIALHNHNPPDQYVGGQGLNARHYYKHFNPDIGFAYKLTPLATLYGSYSEANAVPTPAELSCASPTASCTLANFIATDPNLKQVVAHTFEAGLRGAFLVPDNGTLTYNVDYYHAVANNDIEFLQSPYLGQYTGYFANIGSVLRQGVDLALKLNERRWDAYFTYSRIQATYQSGFLVSSHNPSAVGGVITVQPGDFLPAIPKNIFKFGADYKITPQWTVGLAGNAQTYTYLHGDQSNQQPPLPGFVTLNFNTSYKVTPRVTVFGEVDNLTDAKYYEFGGFSSPAGEALTLGSGYNNPRAYSVAAPIGGYAGVRVKF